MRRILLVQLLIVLLAASVYSAEPAQPADAALVDLNRSFIAAHAAANKLNLARGGPVILLRDGQIVLIHDDTESSANVILPEYDTLKVVAHAPVAIYLMLGPPGAGKLDAQRLVELREYHKKLVRAENSIDQAGLSREVLKRQKKMLAAARRFLDTILMQQTFTMKELYAFTRHMTPMIEANLAGAAKSQLDAMHRQVMAWKQEIAPEEWKLLRVAVKGAVLARDGSIAKQYFERLLHVEKEGLRLVYMERYAPPAPMLKLLATRTVDEGIGVAIFDDPERMMRDVLADAATAYIKEMKFD